MPDYGNLTVSNHPFATPAIAPLYPPPPWEVEDVQTLQITVELKKDYALKWLPASVMRPNPAYGHVMVRHYPRTPVGPFTVAHQFLMSRLRVLPRAIPVLSIIDNADALPALREAWGYPCKLGKIALERTEGKVWATVERPAGRTLARIEMTELRPLPPGDLRYDPQLTLRWTPPTQEGRPPDFVKLTQIDPPYLFKESYRGEGVLTYPAHSPADPWYQMECMDVICTTYSLCDTELPWARFLEDVPA